MPDQDRKPSFMHTLSQDPGDEAARCPSCRGTAGVTFQDDCVCCGREVVVYCQVPKAEDTTNSVKALKIKTEVPDGPQSVIIPSIVQESKPVIPVAAGCRPSNERQRRSNIPTLRPGAGTRYGSLGQLQQQKQQHTGDNSRSAVRIYQQQPQFVVGRPSSSSRRGPARGSSRGSAGRGTGGAHPRYKGVRTRKGVKGFLVEIRPPKWKKTIWLGTYNTSVEAARAYDAGVFYTKKVNTKYNFDTSEGAFPPLPAHLRLDRPDNTDDIKLFVQSQARAAARRMGNTMLKQAATQTGVENYPVGQPTSSGSCLTGNDSANSVCVNADLQTASTEGTCEIESQIQIPMDLDYLGQYLHEEIVAEVAPMDLNYLDQCLHEETAAEEAAKDMFLDYTLYVIQQGGPGDGELLPEEDV